MYSKMKLFLGSSLCVGLNVSVAFAGSLPTNVDKQTAVHSASASPAVHVVPVPEMRSQQSKTVTSQVRYAHHNAAKKRIARMSSHRASAEVKANYYTVRAGDSLWSIAMDFHVTVYDLAHWNHMSLDSMMHPGLKLVIYGGQTSRASTLSGRSDSSPSPGMGNAVLGLEIAQYAERFSGVPYVWGGESPSGFDCSGLVQFAFAHFGIHLGRTSYDQFGEGNGVSREALQAGDLVFFSTFGPGASHVGIYVGGGRFINGAGSSVQIDSLSDGYWANAYLGARSVI